MDEPAELMLKARSGDPESQRLLLVPRLRNLRLCAAAFLPTLADIDRLARLVALEAARTFADAPEGEAFASWLRGLMRTQLTNELTRLAGDPERQGDPLARVMITSARERLKSRIADIDPEEALQRRLNMTPKGALDLLAQRFSRGQPLARLAEVRGLSVDDLAIALQTACRQLDWSGDAFCGAAVDVPLYHTLDGLLCNDPDMDGSALRRQVFDDADLAQRVERAARAYLIAAAWYTPELTLDARELAPGTRRSTNTNARRIPTPASGSPGSSSPGNKPEDRPAPKPTSAGTRRIAAPSRRGVAAEEQSVDQQQKRTERGSRTATIIIFTFAGLLVVGGLLALTLRGGGTLVSPARPATPADVRPTVITTPSDTDKKPVSPTPAPAVVPAGDRQALFVSGVGALPTPLVAYSVRRLVGSYSGPLLRVRRSSDQTERDIAATSTGGLDTATLTLFVGKADGHVVSWYDQSGAGNHLTQPAPETQPLIAHNGTLETENGRPVITFDRAKFQHLATPGAVQAGSLFVLVRTSGPNSGAQGLIGSKSDGSVELDGYYPIVDRDRSGKGEWWIGQRDKHDKLEFPMPAKQLVLWASTTDGANMPTLTVQLDGVTVASKLLQSPGVPAIGPTVVGCIYWHHNLVDPFSGSLSEIIMLPPSLAPEAQAAITANLKTWWHLP